MILRRLRLSRLGFACAGLFLLVAAACVLGPPLLRALAGLDGLRQDVGLGAAPPSLRHWLGTDVLGRDLLVRTLEGGRITLAVGLTGAAVALVIGVLYGATAAYAGGLVDDAMMRVVDVLYALPAIVFVIVLMAVLGSRSLLLLFALLGAVSWLTLARIVRTQVRSLAGADFVVAARALGASPARVLLRHIVPMTLGPVIVYATLAIPAVMLQEAFLSFLGLGVQAPRASLGTLIAEGAQQIVVYPWLLAGPAALMVVTVLALSFLGDALRDALDPRGEGR